MRVSGGGTFGRRLSLNEIVRAGLPWWDGAQISEGFDEGTRALSPHHGRTQQESRSVNQAEGPHQLLTTRTPSPWTSSPQHCENARVLRQPPRRQYVCSAARTDGDKALWSRLREPVRTRSLPLSAEPSSCLTRDAQQAFGEFMIIGSLYAQQVSRNCCLISMQKSTADED